MPVKRALFLAASILIAGCGPDEVVHSVCTPTEGVVARVIDGDTVELMDGSTVRYLLVDTPETDKFDPTQSDCFGIEAKLLNESLVLGKSVELRYDIENDNVDQCTDSLKRRLAYVYVGDRMVNQILIERGYADLCTVKPQGRTTDYLYQADFTAYRDYAAYHNVGMWGACAVIGGACQ